MTTFYARIAVGSSYKHSDGLGGGFTGISGSIHTEAENRAQAFIKIYRELSEHHPDITALKAPHHDLMLGFTADEWKEIAKEGIRVKEGYPEKQGVQIEIIRDRPFN